MSDENALPQFDAGPTQTSPVDPQSIEGLFLAALAKSDGQERQAFLNEACADEDQRRRVTALLRAYDDAGSFLETPAADQMHEPGRAATHAPEDVPLDFLAPSDQPEYRGRLGPYYIIDVIGRGGMGIVLRALDTKLNRIVAVKVLAPEWAANPNARRRFLREARAAAAVSHPHVVTIHAVDEDRLPYLVMECVVGQSLQQKLDLVGSLPLTEVLRIGRQVAEGLAAAHKVGLIHRDIKPANILLENGVERVKITDFGLARAADDVAITRTGEVSGTPQFMSPEQARGEPLDQRSDLFSLGCVLYAMCTGRPPFRGDSLAAVIRRVIEDTPRPIPEINPEMPAWLVDLIQRLLAKQPDARQHSAQQVADIVAAQLAGVQAGVQVAVAAEFAAPGVGAAAAAPGESSSQAAPPGYWDRRYRRFWALAAVVALGLFGALSRSFHADSVFWGVLAVALPGWLLLWRSKRDGLRPWADLSYWDPVLGTGGFVLGVALSGNWIAAGAGFRGLACAGAVLLGTLLIFGRRTDRAQQAALHAAEASSGRLRSSRSRLLAGGLVLALLLPLLILGASLLIPALARAKPVPLTLDWDPATPVVSVQMPLGRTSLIPTRPFTTSLPPGQHEIRVQYEADGVRREVSQVISVQPGKAQVINLSKAIAEDRRNPAPAKQPPAARTPDGPAAAEEEPDQAATAPLAAPNMLGIVTEGSPVGKLSAVAEQAAVTIPQPAGQSKQTD